MEPINVLFRDALYHNKNEGTTVYTNVDTNISYTGYSIDLLAELAKNMSFEYELYEAPDGKFGHLNDKGEWDGVINELIEDVSSFMKIINLWGMCNNLTWPLLLAD